ncbi:MAG: hypothetical protein ACRDT2_07375 [Natronosporangium sp.]
MPPLLRRLLSPALSAVLALAMAVPATWYLAERRADEATQELLEAAAGPVNRKVLRAELEAQLPGYGVEGAVLLEPAQETESAIGLAPGRYAVHVICGLLRRQATEPAEYVVHLGTAEQGWRVTVPCPSTMLTMDQELDFTGQPAGAVRAYLEFVQEGPRAPLLLFQFVPVSGG